MLKERVPETDEGLQGEDLADAYNEMQRHIRDRGWLDEKVQILLGLDMKAGCALEIGSGPGYFGLEWLRATKSQAPDNRLIGLEISQDMIRVALGNAAEYGRSQSCAYQLGDCHDMPFADETFDFAFSHASMHEWVSPTRVWQEVWRVLKPGGRYCILDLRRDLSREAITFMRINIDPSMRKGFLTSVRAAYTASELREMLAGTELAQACVQDTELGLFLSGVKPYAPSPRRPSDPERLGRLNAALAYAVQHSPFYRNRGVVSPLAALPDLVGLPFTTRQDLSANRPFGMLAAPWAELIRYAESGGPAGEVRSSFVTAEDWSGNCLAAATAWKAIFDCRDTLAVAVAYELSFAGADVDRVAEHLGAAVLSVGTNNRICSWQRLLQLMRAYEATGLICTPTRALRLAEIARSEGLDPRKDFALRKIVCLGEPLSEPRRRRIEETWGVEAFSHYGVTEAMAVAAPCAKGAMHLLEDRFVWELVEPEDGTPAKADRGELVLTTLAQKAAPLVRLRTGDIVECAEGPCSCGNPHQAIRHLGRACSAVATPAGRLVPADFDEIVLAEPEVEPFFRIGGQDGRATLQVAAATSDAARWSAARQRLADAVERKFGFRPEVLRADRDAWRERIDNCVKFDSALSADIPQS